ncbi:Tetratricopeptide repeat protein 38 [Merluccius polli]|uniref:Tetratricopeptide repeat protein 38 n=1 Tax=Merluccius polli TaxID=89951 RepID=A0AA47M6X0_MERPO|nr:Tetratricopeptide repeat protein 38 [Merluccius polli]
MVRCGWRLTCPHSIRCPEAVNLLEPCWTRWTPALCSTDSKWRVRPSLLWASQRHFSERDRWQELLRVTLPHTNDHVMVFNDVHFLMASLGAQETDASQRPLEGLRDVGQ